MALWFLRHGESEANAQGLFAGRSVDSPLTAKGCQQARDAAALLPPQLEWIVSSPLRRAVDTAVLVRDTLTLDLTIEVDERICEWDIGQASGTPVRMISAEEMIELFAAEDLDHFDRRVSSAIDDLRRRKGTGLLVSHAGVARAFLARESGYSPSDFRRVPVPKNCIPFLMF